MREVGVDISGQRSETLDRYLDAPFDYVVTVCDDANEACPVFPGAKVQLHWSLPDPSAVTGEGRMGTFREVRDRIRALIRPELLGAKGNLREKAEGAVLFLCTQNSARSQMAEWFLRHLAGGRFEVMSAGLDLTDEVHPCAVQAMAEVGIDISDQRPKRLGVYLGREFFNYLVIVCARAEERCPITLPAWGCGSSGSSTTPALTRASPTTPCCSGSGQVRDEIEIRVKDWLENPEAELERLRESRERERLLAGGRSSSRSG